MSSIGPKFFGVCLKEVMEKGLELRGKGSLSILVIGGGVWGESYPDLFSNLFPGYAVFPGMHTCNEIKHFYNI
jgi:hypothetical protein